MTPSLKELEEVEEEITQSLNPTIHIRFSSPKDSGMAGFWNSLRGPAPWQPALDAITMANPHSSC